MPRTLAFPSRNSLEIPLRVVGNEIAFPDGIRDEIRPLPQERLHGTQRTFGEIAEPLPRKERVDDAVLHDQVAPHAHEGRVRVEVPENLVAAVSAVVEDET